MFLHPCRHRHTTLSGTSTSTATTSRTRVTRPRTCTTYEVPDCLAVFQAIATHTNKAREGTLVGEDMTVDEVLAPIEAQGTRERREGVCQCLASRFGCFLMLLSEGSFPEYNEEGGSLCEACEPYPYGGCAKRWPVTGEDVRGRGVCCLRPSDQLICLCFSANVGVCSTFK